MPSPTPEEIRELRAALGLTQAQFGEIADSARRTVEDWEAGRRNMPALKFKAAQDKLNGNETHTVYVCARPGENRNEEILDSARFRSNLEQRAQRRADRLAAETGRDDWTVLKITYTGYFGR